MIKDILRGENIEIVVSQSSKNGMVYCGDDYFFLHTKEYFVCVLADGLGSGKYAYESSHAVIEEVTRNHELDVESLMAVCNQVLIDKRGAAVSILKIFYDKNEFVYSSVGNIRFFLYNPTVDKIVYPLPVTGYLSGRKQKYRTERYKYEPNAKFILHSDGLELKGAKTFLKRQAPMEVTARAILESSPATADDTTFILGSLLSL
ncbi:SpoIIE family protein phosphatase [Peribacillus sp. SI8-4]|uniref:SpoIIE family protein phosphatase n=1 Tax=Peribacillus sp. SI8-4 TaxID=3048009 RepID=UPI0025569DB1|nr:SpoIIE family protein phosphatase [Peribacillus sp. SI8-4]